MALVKADITTIWDDRFGFLTPKVEAIAVQFHNIICVETGTGADAPAVGDSLQCDWVGEESDILIIITLADPQIVVNSYIPYP